MTGPVREIGCGDAKDLHGSRIEAHRYEAVLAAEV